MPSERSRPEWVRELAPVDPAALSRSVLVSDKVEEFVAQVGTGSAGWAVELGQAMAAHIIAEVPELDVDGIVQMVRDGCEVVALEAVAALAGFKDFTVEAAPEVLLGPAEVVSRGVGVEHILRSIQVGHSMVMERVLDAAERYLPPQQRFSEIRRITARLFGIADRLASEMARAYGDAHEAWVASSAAARMEVVQQILRGGPVPADRAVRLLGYDLTRQHVALVGWSDERVPAGASRLEETVANLLESAGCSSALVIPVGGRRVWAWGSRIRRLPVVPDRLRQPMDGVRVAVGVPAAGIRGFVTSHQQASEVAQLGMLTSGERWLFDYGELDLITMLGSRLDRARKFVIRELGALAGPEEATTVLRTTLKCYLDVERSLSAAAENLHVARNTVAYRVQRAEQLRGRVVGVRRMQLQAALALAEELGAMVLGDADRRAG
ncbi:DNA-binding PucR family transcriptional regulator [Nocardia kruczakiae]|uniref:DNA-binding PucR family transcriptional regulator n=1 Tax=Nocardia kruczakiae TaxID=261477 RepID=A0ABU1XQZ3_9NOCA|nr:helix-turn-helix domain-containing protein [Nocardia kruczakiae]MDR7172987.1 DNA-binding PucR family transcriptional regulator [Nocardia kruczakiae]